MSQAAFAKALLQPDLEVPAGLTDPEGRVSTKRFNVYRNNVAASLTEALQTGFPVLQRLVGEEFFKAMAGVFLRAHPPGKAVMMGYGADMPVFLEGFPPVAHLPYLADVARLELALRDSYHAADYTALPPETFAAIPADALMARRFRIAPPPRLLRSRYPLYGIWRANTDPQAPQPGTLPEDVAVLRPEYDPEVVALAPGAYGFFAALAEGQSFGDAIAAAEADSAEFDLTHALQLAFANRLFAEDTP